MMRILLVYTNRYRRMAPPPVGLAFLVKPLEETGHVVKIVDLMYSMDPVKDLNDALDAFKPDVAGFSIRNIDNQDMLRLKSFMPEAREYVETAKRKGAIVILGGTAFTIFPFETMEYMGADYGIAGQGERSLPLLIGSLEARQVDKSIPGLVWREDGKLRMNVPDFSGYRCQKADWSAIDLKGYASLVPGAVITKAGCPYRCSYCNVSSAFGDRFVFRDVGDIVDDFKAIKEAHGINNFFLTDACFNSPLEHAKDVLRAIIKSGLKIYLNATVVPVSGQYDDELFRLYRRAGGISLMIGAETFSERMLRNYNKPFALDDVRECCRLCEKHRMPFFMQAMFGGPGETNETVRESMDFLSGVKYASFSYGIGVRIQPGTRLYETAKSEGMIKDESELFMPKFYVSRQMDMEWAKGYIKKRSLQYAYRNLRMAPYLMRCALAKHLNVIY